MALLHSDLKDMGISSTGHRLTILKGVYHVKIKQNIPFEPDHYVPLCKSLPLDLELGLTRQPPNLARTMLPQHRPTLRA